MKKGDKEFWGVRSKKYNELEWAQHQDFLKRIIELSRFDKTNIALDLGTGTGIVAHAIMPKVRSVIAIDSSNDMLEIARLKKGNIEYVQKSVTNLDNIYDCTVDRITCRYVVHHLIKNGELQKCLKECERVLKDYGLCVIAEGVPPSKKTKKDFIKIFKIKEDRLTFTTKELCDAMNEADFLNVQSEEMILKQMSVKNWLEKSGLPKIKQDEIFEIHKKHYDDNDYFKADYGMTEKDGDLLINMKVCIVVGEKHV